MVLQRSETIIRGLLDLAEIQVNGKNPWDIQVHDAQFYDVVFTRRTVRTGRILHERLVG